METTLSSSLRNLSSGDLKRISHASLQLHQADPEESFLRQCFRILKPAIGHVHLSAEMYSTDLKLTEVVNPTVNAYWISVFTNFMEDHPYVERMLSDAPRHLETIQQDPTLRDFRKTPLFNEFYEKVQGQNLLWFASKNQGEILSLAVLRKEEYSENELALASIIHPHLESAWKNWKQMRALQQDLGVLKEAFLQTPAEEMKAASVRKAIDALTSRQRDVVELVTTGLDNQQIADQLKISIFTVKKHLQAVFQSLEVQHRTQLAAKWHQAHSVMLY
jgi:ATP/maltotriose-dependent transcriptional regulator MalT